MIKKKNLYRVTLITGFVIINLLILFGISQILSYLNTGADRASILHLKVKNEQVYLPKTIWKDTLNPGRPVEKQTLIRLQEDYLKAWYVRNIAYKTNNTFGIDDYYTQSARTNIYKHIEDQKTKNSVVDITTLKHDLYLDFYSADGQLAVLTDKHNKEYQRVYKDGALLLETQIDSQYRVMLLLEDGFWKIRHLVKQKEVPEKSIEFKPTLIQVKDGNIYINNQLFTINGINYYPQDTPWDLFGDGFDLDILSKDFEIIRNARLNTIRIFVPYENFGKAEVLPKKLQKLKLLLDEADKKKIKVIVTLFDFYGNYDVIDWTLTHRHAEKIVSTFKEHPAILAWDIKNEPNLDFDTRGKVNVVAWLKEMSRQIRSFDSNHLVTIGWSNLESAKLLETEVDLISFHYYQDIKDFEEAFENLRTQTNKPIVLQEYGLSSNRNLWNPLGNSRKSQANYYKDFGNILRHQNIHNLSWTLYDFRDIPTSVVGKLPWRKQKQKHFGFIDINGDHKPSFEYIKN